MGGRVGWLRILLILRLSQPSLAGVGAGAELGNIITVLYLIIVQPVLIIIIHTGIARIPPSTIKLFINIDIIECCSEQ